MHTIARILLLLFLGSSAMAAEVRVPLPDRDDFVLEVPDEWRHQVRRERADHPPTIALTSANRLELVVLITPLWAANASIPVGNPDDLRKLVQGAANAVKSRAVEENLALVEFSAPGKMGYYFSATDKAPEENGYKYLTQGAVGFNDLRVTFTILINGEQDRMSQQALQILRSLRRAPRRNSD